MRANCPVLLVLSALALLACGGSFSPPGAEPDAGTPSSDAGPTDSGTDAGPTDSGTDAGPADAGTDAGPADAGTDAGPTDAGMDAGPTDAGMDAGPSDAGTDGGPADAGPVATVQGCNYQGLADGDTWSFRGIPFAAPPVGELRLAPPAPATACSGTRDATQFSSVCLQPVNDGGTLTIEGSEDCLTLNVWTPAPTTSGSHPVLFFTHGGGLVQGAGSDALYDGSRLAAQSGAVIVTINYRLGGIGFLAHPALSAEVSPATSGNYGILDQIAALQWVHDNIAAFGGDPARVTISGQSAGATSTLVQLASPLTHGLFARAIVESPGGHPVLPTLADAEAAGETLATQLGCGDGSGTPACLRALPAGTLLLGTAQDDEIFTYLLDGPPYFFLPNVDGHLLTGEPLDVFTDGGPNQVPVLIGNTAQEAGYFVLTKEIPPAAPASFDDNAYDAGVQMYFGANADAVLAEYPASTYGNDFQAWLAALTDAAFICPNRHFSQAIVSGQSAPVYRYLFTEPLRGPNAIYGAYHTLELFFVFGTLSDYGYTLDAQELAFTSTMQEYWGNFIATGNPNDTTAVAWPPDDAADSYLQLGPTTAAAQGVRTSQCNFWDSLGANY